MRYKTPIKTRAMKYLYKNVLKKVLFLFDPEDVHNTMVSFGQFLGNYKWSRSITAWLFDYHECALFQDVLGIKFSNPIGLAAGFDKEARLTNILPHVGFGYEEIGSITGNPCAGNPKPRLFRLKRSRSLVVYYGLKNDGAGPTASRLKGMKFKFPVGVSIAKTNDESTITEEAGILDYMKAYRAFVDKNIGDYFTINISCPNTFGGEPFTDPSKLDRLLKKIREVDSNKPVFLKMPSELPYHIVDQIINVARKYKVSGFVCTNLAKDRNNKNIMDKEVSGKGGMSGKVVEDLSDELIKYIYGKTRDEFVIIGCGGIFSAEDAYKKIKYGATLLQLITGMIYEGPQLIGEINRGLVELLKKDGYKNISEAIGVSTR